MGLATQNGVSPEKLHYGSGHPQWANKHEGEALGNPAPLPRRRTGWSRPIASQPPRQRSSGRSRGSVCCTRVSRDSRGGRRRRCGPSSAAWGRQDGTGAHTLDSAHDKAFTSASYGSDTLALALVSRVASQPTLSTLFAKLPNLLLFGGGVVIKVGDEVAGAIPPVTTRLNSPMMAIPIPRGR